VSDGGALDGASGAADGLTEDSSDDARWVFDAGSADTAFGESSQDDGGDVDATDVSLADGIAGDARSARDTTVGDVCNGDRCIVEIAETGWFVDSMAVDATTLYWSTTTGLAPGSGTIVSLSLSGGAPVTLAMGGEWLRAIAIDDSNVYWTDYYGGLVSKVPKAGGNPVVLASQQEKAIGIAVDDTNVYWSNATGIMKVGKAGGTPEMIAYQQPGPQAIAVDRSSVYWGGSGSIYKVALTGGTPVVVGTGGDAISMAVDDTNVYALIGDIVTQVPLAGGPSFELGRADTFARAITIDKDAVYLAYLSYETAGGPANGAVVKFAIGGGSAMTLASAQAASAVAVDGTYVYWGSQGKIRTTLK
jgi:hypothetical protein